MQAKAGWSWSDGPRTQCIPGEFSTGFASESSGATCTESEVTHTKLSHAGSPAAPIKLSDKTLTRICDGTLTAFTAGANASGDNEAPLEFEIHKAAATLRDARGTLLGYLQHFLTRSNPERIRLGEEHSRIVHDAHAKPLCYASCFRSGWYKVNDGEHLNEPGDTNPFPQAFVIISGHGRAKIGDVETEIRAGESYYVPPGSDHFLTPAARQLLEMIWFAWGEGA